MTFLSGNGSEDFEDRARGPATAGRTDLRARAWVLLALDAASRNGITPLSKKQFHRLVYLTNALSPLYGVRAADERIVKFTRGQFYPDLQWHLDRLAVQGIVRISDLRHFVDDDGPWMEANYRLNQSAVPIIQRIVELTDMQALADFLLEVTKAYASQDDEALDDLILADVTYDDARRARGAVIDFSASRDNLSVRAANSFATLVRDPRWLTASDRVHLYVEYMDRVRPARRGA